VNFPTSAPGFENKVGVNFDRKVLLIEESILV
jgi:hypothetical protein